MKDIFSTKKLKEIIIKNEKFEVRVSYKISFFKIQAHTI